MNIILQVHINIFCDFKILRKIFNLHIDVGICLTAARNNIFVTIIPIAYFLISYEIIFKCILTRKQS